MNKRFRINVFERASLSRHFEEQVILNEINPKDSEIRAQNKPNTIDINIFQCKASFIINYPF